MVIGDGQVTMGSQVVKTNMRKVRKIHNDNIVAGFAGSTADALALFDLLESKLEAHSGQLLRAAVEFAKDWRLQKAFGRLDATIIVADGNKQLQITGNGEVLEPVDGILSGRWRRQPFSEAPEHPRLVSRLWMQWAAAVHMPWQQPRR